MPSTTMMNNMRKAIKLVDDEEWEANTVYNLSQALHHLLATQECISACVPGAIPPGEPTPEQVRTYTLALIVELTEWLNEWKWKPWKPGALNDTPSIRDEFADILAFIGILLVYMNRVGIEPDDIATAYWRKTQTNVERFLGKVGGYERSD